MPLYDTKYILRSSETTLGATRLRTVDFWSVVGVQSAVQYRGKKERTPRALCTSCAALAWLALLETDGQTKRWGYSSRTPLPYSLVYTTTKSEFF